MDSWLRRWRLRREQQDRQRLHEHLEAYLADKILCWFFADDGDITSELRGLHEEQHLEGRAARLFVEHAGRRFYLAGGHERIQQTAYTLWPPDGAVRAPVRCTWFLLTDAVEVHVGQGMQGAE